MLFLPPCPSTLCSAKRIEVSVARNEIMDQSSLIARYQQEIQLLKGQLDMVMREREWAALCCMLCTMWSVRHAVFPAVHDAALHSEARVQGGSSTTCSEQPSC